mgnify:CR=1 FL=1
MKRITAHEILVHGIEHEQYWQGAGCSFSEYTDIATGIGDNAREAYDDALEQLASSGWNVDKLPRRPRGVNAKLRVPASWLKDEMCDAHVYVSIRVRGPKGAV